MTVDLDRVGYRSEPVVWHWTPADCSLYALCIGAGFDELPYVLAPPHVERVQVYPTFALALVARDASHRPDPVAAAGDFGDAPAVLGEQWLELHRPLEPAGSVAVSVACTAIYDKGSGTVIVLESHGVDPSDPSVRLFSATMPMFVIGVGNWGGPPGPPRSVVAIPEREPDHVESWTTPAVQSLLYMHAGNDDHAIHVDPAVATAAGFTGPILTGQNSLGAAGRAIVRALGADGRLAIRSIGGRFRQPAYNGDTLSTRMWVEGSDATASVVFQVVNQDGSVLVDGGRCELSTPDA